MQRTGRGSTLMVDYAAARELMVDTQIRPRNVTDKRLLWSMLNVPRERFVPEARVPLAYSDSQHDLGAANGRILTSPEAFARLASLAEIDAADVVLDVACATGYSTAVLAGMASAVVAIENDADLVARAENVLTELEIGNAAVLEADLTAGLPSEAPFDVIVVNGAVEYVPEPLLAQLREGGRLVAPVRGPRTAIATIFARYGGEITSREAFELSMPELSQFFRPLTFAF